MNIQHIALADLVASPRNVRKVSDDDDDESTSDEEQDFGRRSPR